MKNISINCVLIMTISMLLMGCGTTWFAERSTNPVIKDKLGKNGSKSIGTLAVTANRRAVIVKLAEGGRGDVGKFCAEPPPDSAENIVYQLGLLFEGQGKSSEPITGAAAEGGGKIDFNKALQTTIQSLTKRSQGLQLYRDGIYNLCQAYLNGVLNEKEYWGAATGLLTQSVSLISQELELTQGNISVTPTAAIARSQ